MANSYIYALTDTWTDGNVTYNAISMTVNATNSHANSNILKLTYNSNTYLRLKKDGTLSVAGNGTFTYVTSMLIANTAAAPANSSASGTAGEIRWDSSYVYLCLANGSWKRAALSTW